MVKKVRIDRRDQPDIAVERVLLALTELGFPNSLGDESEDHMDVFLGEADAAQPEVYHVRPGAQHDPRYGENSTGVFVRAQCDDGTWMPADIAQLTKESLIAWLRSRPRGAEQTVLILLGHPHE